MPVYKLQGPDGKVYTIEGPEGATAEQLGAFITSQGDERKARVAAQVEADRKLYNPTNGMSTFDKLAAGAGKAVYDTGQGIGQLLGMVDRKDVEETRKRDAALMDTGAGMAGNIVGNVGMALAPGGAVAGAGKLLSKVPQAAKLAEALMAGGKTFMAPTSIPAAATVGAVQGAVQPSTSTSETLGNVALGGGAGAAIPTLVRAGQVAKAAIDPFSKAGQDRILGRALKTASGNDAAVLPRLQEATAPFIGPTPEGLVPRTVMGEIVPGSMPTVGQAAQNPGIAALARTATATDPAVAAEMERRMLTQNAARVDELGDLAGTGGKRDFHVANRDATANDLYGEARRQGVDPASFTPEAQANIASFQQRVPDDIMARARELAKINGVNMDNESSVQGLHWIKTAIDSKIGSAQASGDKEMARAYLGLKNTLLDGMDAISPAYGQARREFSAMSKPINAMDTAQAIADRATNPLTGKVQPQAYARALDDKTAQSVTGMKTATLENTMPASDLNRLERLKEDLARANYADTAGKGSGSDTIQKLAYSNLMDQSGLPSFVRALPGMGTVGGIAQRVGKLAYQDANDTMRTRLAEALVNPQDAIGLLQASQVTPQMQMMIENLRRGGAGVGAAAPYLLNATKE